MVRLSDLTPEDREHMLAKPCHAFEPPAWVAPPPLSRARVALVTTAGVQRRSDRAFELKTAEYRVIPRDTSPADIVMNPTFSTPPSGCGASLISVE